MLGQAIKYRFGPRAMVLASVAMTTMWVPWATSARGQNPETPETKTTEEQTSKLFEQTVLPILQEHCFECHSHEYDEAAGKLMLDSRRAMLDGGTRGPALAKNLSSSLLLRALEYEDTDLQMPPAGKLSDTEIASIRDWLSAGAQVPKSWEGSSSNSGNDEPTGSGWQSHWAYQPIAEPPNSEAGASRASIDSIVSQKLNETNLSLSPRADREQLIRRVHYDLIGLPPDFETTLSFQSDPRPDKVVFEELVDRLLGSSQFGERWARVWMDVARYADNKGYVFREDREYPKAYEYRDWLITSFNEDRPFDDFVRQQLAADLLDDGSHADLPALGFLTLGRRFLNNKFDIIDDRIDVVSRGLMGMTLSCARCHDHKYDPLSQKDYYALFGVFLNSEEPKEKGHWLHQVKDRAKMLPAHVLVRGSAGRRGEKVPRRFVSFLSEEKADFPSETSGRLELANRITAPDNPLTARVIANRIWLQLNGSSLVLTPSDFGLRCPPPEQQELLNHLAASLIADDWSLKSLIRRIVLSNVYAQSSQSSETAAAIDPTNTLHWRHNRRRLDFESLRDTLLTRTGNLDTSFLGPSVPIERASSSTRRTVYAYIDRQNLPSIFRTFDFASPDSHNPKRAETSVPQQGLFMLNSDFIAEQTRLLAERAEEKANEAGTKEAVQQLFQQILAREPNANESRRFTRYLEQQSSFATPPTSPRWTYGFGEWNLETNSLTSFEELEHFTGTAWQGGPELPDPVRGWCILNADGGHPGNDLRHAVVRKLRIEQDGFIRVTGRLKHNSDKGDGVRSHLCINGQQKQEWTAHNKQVQTKSERFEVSAGQTLELVTDCISGPGFDGFTWKVDIVLSSGDTGRETIRTPNDFSGPPPKPLTPWQQVVQILLATNELAFVD
ncbi:MAG: PSD1 and planctomycete cytochrome C domain-containing protein [Pirellulaceae bacterium]